MPAITAGMVKELREKTDAPMMECKKALTEADGDMVKAEELLRIKLGNKATKAASRITAEGVVGVYVSDDRKLAAIVELNCETDFVAKNDDFLAFAAELAKQVALKNPADVAALSALPLDGGTVEEVRAKLVGRIGENMTIRRFARIEGKGLVSHYVHGGSRIGVLVDLLGGDDVLGKDIAMHTAASRPKALTADQVPADLIESERRVAREKAAEDAAKQNKTIPEDILQKRIEGTVQKFLKEVTLLGQPFVKDDKQTIEGLLKSRDATVDGFVLFVVGEGIEKKSVDFAAEVEAQVAATRK